MWHQVHVCLSKGEGSVGSDTGHCGGLGLVGIYFFLLLFQHVDPLANMHQIKEHLSNDAL